MVDETTPRDRAIEVVLQARQKWTGGTDGQFDGFIVDALIAHGLLSSVPAGDANWPDVSVALAQAWDDGYYASQEATNPYRGDK